MQKITISQTEYKKLVENQRELQARVDTLQRVIEGELGEDIRPEVLRRIEKRSKAMDGGAGTKLKSVKEIKAFFRNL